MFAGIVLQPPKGSAEVQETDEKGESDERQIRKEGDCWMLLLWEMRPRNNQSRRSLRQRPNREQTQLDEQAAKAKAEAEVAEADAVRHGEELIAQVEKETAKRRQKGKEEEQEGW